MSSSWLIIIPTDPQWQPEHQAAAQAARVLAKHVPRAELIEMSMTDDVEFVDAGSNFDSVTCPHCGAEVTEAWADGMDAAYESGFANLDWVAPCCNRETSLNALNYQQPQGFARFSITATEPNLERIDDQVLRSLGEALGHEVRAVWQHL